jgi:protein-L-isoaspartate(D-aspartate) O-methyltransferase
MRFNDKTSISTGNLNVTSYRSKSRLNISAAPIVPVDDANDYDMARFIMALRARGIRNTALMSAFEHTARVKFFEPTYEPYLYQDISLPLPCGEEASSPHVIAQVLAAAALIPKEQVLEIGTGSGYQTALISLLASRVVSIDRYRTLATLARKSLAAVGLTQIDLRVGDGLAGYDLPQANFDCIIVNGLVNEIPEVLADRLLPNGRLILCMEREGVQLLHSIVFSDDAVRASYHGTTHFAPMKLGRAVAL